MSLLLLLLACGGPVPQPNPEPQDTASVDTSVQDTGPTDTGLLPPRATYTTITGARVFVALGDVDGDGEVDVAFSNSDYQDAWTDESEFIGIVQVLPGPVDHDLDLFQAPEVVARAGSVDEPFSYVSAPGDLDGDGLADLIVGSWGAERALMLFTHPLQDLDTPAWTLHSSGYIQPYGARGVGDLSDDGNADLLVASQKRRKAYIMLFDGPLSGDNTPGDARVVFAGERDWHLSSASTANIGDVNGDGLYDIAIGLAHLDDSTGKTFLLLGPFDGDRQLADADAIYVGEAPLDDAGLVVARLGDVNGDGLDDLGIGAHKDGGRAYVIFGPTLGSSSLANAPLIICGGDDVGVASALLDVGDRDQDGTNDFVIGSQGALYLAESLSLGTHRAADLPMNLAPYASQYFGHTLANLGDLDGDGLDEVLVGAEAAHLLWGAQLGR